MVDEMSNPSEMLPSLEQMRSGFLEATAGQGLDPEKRNGMFAAFTAQVAVAEDFLRRGEAALNKDDVPAVVLGHAAGQLMAYGFQEEAERLMATVRGLPQETRVVGFSSRMAEDRNSDDARGRSK